MEVPCSSRGVPRVVLLALMLVFILPAHASDFVPDSSPTALIGQERGLVILVDYADTTDADRAENFTLDEIRELMVTNEDSIEYFMRKSSRDQYEIRFDVIDYHTLIHPASHYAALNRDEGVSAAALEAFREIEVTRDLQQYDRVMMLMQNLPVPYGPGCFASSFYSPALGRRMPVTWLSLARVGCITKTGLAHELGHTMGFPHSMWGNCEAAPASLFDISDMNASCQEWETLHPDLGDTRSVDLLHRASDMLPGGIAYDVMDGRWNNDVQYDHVFNAVHQHSVGWLGDDEFLQLQHGDDSLFTLTMLESPQTVDGVRLLTVDLGEGSDGYPYRYHIEYRQFAACAPVLHLQGPRFGWQEYPNQEAPGTTYIMSGDFREPTFATSSVFHDPHRGIRFEVLDCDPDQPESLQMQVSFSELLVEPPVTSYSTGDIRTVEMNNDNSVPVQVGQAHVSGRNPWAFSIVEDGCSGASLAAGAQCQIRYQYNPSSDEDVAVMFIPNNDALRGQATVTLHGKNVDNLALSNRRFSEVMTARYYPATHLMSFRPQDDYAGLLLLTMRYDDEDSYHEMLFELNPDMPVATFDYIGSYPLGTEGMHYSPFGKAIVEADWSVTHTFRDIHNIGTWSTADDELLLPIVEFIGPDRAFMTDVVFHVDSGTKRMTIADEAGEFASYFVHDNPGLAPEPLPPLPTERVSGLPSLASIRGGVRDGVTQALTDKISAPSEVLISAVVQPEEGHIGKSAAIVVVVETGGVMLTVSQAGEMAPLNESQVEYFRTIDSLQAENQLTLFSGILAESDRGEYNIFVGYLAEGDTQLEQIIYGAEPIRLVVE